MSEAWQWFLVVGGGIIFIANVIGAVIMVVRYVKRGKDIADAHYEKKIRDVISEDRKHNCQWIINSARDAESRKVENEFFMKSIVAVIEPIKEDVRETKELLKKLHHSQMTDLQIKLSHLFHDIFDKKGKFTKTEQTNWDKWFSDYEAIGGNSDIKRMNELVQATRVAMTIGKLRSSDQELLMEEGEKNEGK